MFEKKFLLSVLKAILAGYRIFRLKYIYSFFLSCWRWKFIGSNCCWKISHLYFCYCPEGNTFCHQLLLRFFPADSSASRCGFLYIYPVLFYKVYWMLYIKFGKSLTSIFPIFCLSILSLWHFNGVKICSHVPFASCSFQFSFYFHLFFFYSVWIFLLTCLPIP